MWNIFKVNYKNIRWRFGVFIDNFEHIPRLFVLFLSLTLNKYILAESVYFLVDALAQMSCKGKQKVTLSIIVVGSVFLR